MQTEEKQMTKIAVIIPCLNEGKTIQKVVDNLRCQIPEAEIFVCDNDSVDGTNCVGAQMIVEKKRGKGNVIKRAVSEIDADYYIFTDGDLTYDTKNAAEFICVMQDEKLDFVNVRRVSSDKKAYKFGRKLGNRIFDKLFNILFKSEFSDILSGYKIVSKDFIKSFEIKSQGFEIETEITAQAVVQNVKAKEFSCSYFPRGEGSSSKLKFFSDGLAIFTGLLGFYFDLKKKKS